METGWVTNDSQLHYTPNTTKTGKYLLRCYMAPVGYVGPNEPGYGCYSADICLEYHPHIKGKCQMPYWGEGGGYLIGVESYDNPNQEYQYEMLILDCTLLAQGMDAWIYGTVPTGVSEGNALWIVWQPQYGYYWTLFRVFDENDQLIDELCYGFVNAY